MPIQHYGTAALPRTTPSYSPTNAFGTGTTYHPADAAALQTLLAGGTLAPGDVIVLTDNVCYNTPAIPRQYFPIVPGASGANPVWVVTSNPARLPAVGNGIRSLTGAITLTTPHFRMQQNNTSGLRVQPRAAGWRFVGLEGDAGSTTSSSGLVELGMAADSAWQTVDGGHPTTFYPKDYIVWEGYICIADVTNSTTPPASDPTHWRPVLATDMPTGIIMDRCLFTASAHSNHCGYVLNANLREMALFGSCFWSEGGPGIEDKAFLSVWGAGPWLIEHNQFTSAGINSLTGGDVPPFDSLPRDVTWRGNWSYKPLRFCANNGAWDGNARIIKNNFELKVGEYWLIEDNIFENHWDGGTTQYFGIVLKVASSSQAGNYYAGAKTSNVTFRYNRLKKLGGLFAIGTRDNLSGDPAGAPPALHDISVYQNYTDGLHGSLSNPGSRSWQFQLVTDVVNLTLERLTFVGDVMNQDVRAIVFAIDTAPLVGFVLRNVLLDGSQTWPLSLGGIANGGSGLDGIDWFSDSASHADAIWFYTNASATAKYPHPPFTISNTPADTLVNRAGGDFHTAAALVGAGYNGETPGADIDAVNAATSGVVSGTWSLGAADHLAINTQPSSSTASGQAHAQQPAGTVQDSGNSTVTGDTSTVTATWVNESGSGSAIGTPTTVCVAGAWSFAGKGLGVTSVADCAGHWHFADGSLTGVDSQTIAIIGSGGPSSPVSPYRPHRCAVL